MSTKDDTILMETNTNEHEEEAMCLIVSPQPSFPNSLCLSAFTPALISASACPGHLWNTPRAQDALCE